MSKTALGYLAPAQQLYEWLITPLQADLDAQQIQNLVFILDQGLRSLPIAALHNDTGFIIEQYSVGLMPTLSLTDTRAVNHEKCRSPGYGSRSLLRSPSLTRSTSGVTGDY